MALIRNNSACRGYCFTINNYTEEEYQNTCKIYETLNLDYLIVGKEVGEENKVPHLQGYLHKSSKLRFKAVQKVLPRAHILAAKGSAEENFKYCSKQNDFVQFGECPKQGKRTDIETVMDAIKVSKGRMTKRELMEEYPFMMCKYGKFFTEYNLECRFDNVKLPVIDLYPWEERILEILALDPMHRRIIWIWSPESETGKTVFGQYVAAYFNRQYIGTSDLDPKNILYMYDQHRVIHFQLTRDLTSAQMEYLNGTLEKFSDGGIMMSGKYESTNKIVEAHVMVTSNQPPNLDKLRKRVWEFRVYPDHSYDFHNHMVDLAEKAIIHSIYETSMRNAQKNKERAIAESIEASQKLYNVIKANKEKELEDWCKGIRPRSPHTDLENWLANPPTKKKPETEVFSKAPITYDENLKALLAKASAKQAELFEVDSDENPNEENPIELKP